MHPRTIIKNLLEDGAVHKSKMVLAVTISYPENMDEHVAQKIVLEGLPENFGNVVIWQVECIAGLVDQDGVPIQPRAK